MAKYVAKGEKKGKTVKVEPPRYVEIVLTYRTTLDLTKCPIDDKNYKYAQDAGDLMAALQAYEGNNDAASASWEWCMWTDNDAYSWEMTIEDV